MKLCFPEQALAQHVCVLGKTGAGKSSALRHMAENRLASGRRFCGIDPKGDWWGLKSSADGKSPGFPVIAFGDFKEPKATDVPINASSGKHVAELVATGNRPCIIGFRGWMPAAMTQFWVDFASTLFNANAGELYLFIDEVHNFAPKGRVMDPAVGKSLHWTNRLMSEGRGIGLVCAIASQRPQKVHNDTLTCCETLVAMRVTHAADRAAIKDWIDGCGDSTGNDVLKSAASLERGEAFVWSPEIGFGPQRVKFPKFTTFDSFAPPQLQGQVSLSGWADVDLNAVRAKFATVIEEAQANDPAALKRRIQQLEAELAKRPTAAPAQPAKTIEVPILTQEHDKILREIGTGILTLELRRQQDSELLKAVENGMRDLRAELGARISSPQTPAMRSPQGVHSAPRPIQIPSTKRASIPLPSTPEDSSLNASQRRVLTVLAQNAAGCAKGKLALLAGYTYSGGFRNILSSLRTPGLIEGGNEEVMRITDRGRRSLGAFEPMPTGRDLAQYWLSSMLFGSGEKAVLRVLLEHPHGMTAVNLAAEAGYTWSGGFRNILSTLRTAGVIVGRNTETIRANPELFD